jgi:hypothetical protein
MKELCLFLIFLIFLIIPTVMASIGIGVEPTKAWITLSNVQPQQILRVKIYDESTTDANYTFIIPEDMKDYVLWDDCSAYWCVNSSYLVPAGLSRANAEIVDILFEKKTDFVGSKNFTITVRAQPLINQTGTVGIVPQVTIDVYLNQVYVSTTTSSVKSTTTTESGGIVIYPTSTQTTSTSTTIFSQTKKTTSTTSTTTQPPSVQEQLAQQSRHSTTTQPQKKGFVWDFWSIFIVAVTVVVTVIVGVFGYLKYIYG